MAKASEFTGWLKRLFFWHVTFRIRYACRHLQRRIAKPKNYKLRNIPGFEGYKKIFLIRINHSYAGLFAYFIYALNQLRYCERKGYYPVVHFGKVSCDGENAYYDEDFGENIWDYYFEPVAGHTCADIERLIEEKQLRKKDVVKLDYDYLTYLHMWSPHSIYGYTYGLFKYKTAYSARWFAEQRRKARETVAKYVTVKPHITAIVDDYCSRHMDGYKVIGVHIRGTDKGAAAASDKIKDIVEPTAYYREIDRFCNEHPQCRIFVATDQVQYLDALKNRYGDQVIHCEAQRSTDNRNPFQLKEGSGYKKGEEALVDCLILSRCSFLLKCTSHLSETSLYFNPDLECLDMNYLVEP